MWHHQDLISAALSSNSKLASPVRRVHSTTIPDQNRMGGEHDLPLRWCLLVTPLPLDEHPLCFQSGSPSLPQAEDTIDPLTAGNVPTIAQQARDGAARASQKKSMGERQGG